MSRVALIAAMAVGLAGCSDDGGVLVEVTQSAEITDKIKTLQLFVGTPDGQSGDFTGVAIPDDVIELAQPLDERLYTIRLVRSPDMPSDTPVRVAVVGSNDGIALGLQYLDLPGVPDDIMLRYQLELQPIGDVVTTDSGCLLLPDGTVVGAVDDRDCDEFSVEDGDCDDLDPHVNPGAFDSCEGDGLGVDEDCNDAIDDGDFDDDGATCTRDCADRDPARTPGNADPCAPGDDVDNDCDVRIDEGIPEVCGDQIDNDCDKATSDQGLDDEVCGDGADNDCDTEIDEGRLGDGGVLDTDVDNDGASCAADCDDDNPDVHPLADEACNQDDDDCDGATDEEANDDFDGALCLNDCDDQNPDRFPGNPEICDIHDNDCVTETRPAPQPCFDYANDPCHYGFQSCDELQGHYSLDCSSVGGNPVTVQPGVCDQFASCSVVADDPLACGGEPTHLCDQLVMANGGVCAGAIFPLTTSGTQNTCMWTIVGGRMQQGWTVGLVPQGGGPAQASVTSCSASFAVEAVPAGLQPGTFVVALFTDGLFNHAEVFSIDAGTTNTCPLPSLVCVTAAGN